MVENLDEKYMARALELAAKGKGAVNPNPLVGAVIVKAGEIIGEGYHEVYGKAHAEVNAIANAIENLLVKNNVSLEKLPSNSLEDATIYVSLEPCCHYGKTPPCVAAIIENGIKTVVVGMVDPHDKVAGKGIEKLREAGVEVRVGVLEEKCRELNEVFIKYIQTKFPFVVMKAAMTLDGKIATYTSESRWISGETSRKLTHNLRNDLTAIMVGVETVIKDDPMLTCRLETGTGNRRNPIRIVVDSTLRIPLEAKILEAGDKIKTIVATTERASKEKIRLLEEKNIQVLIVEQKDNRVDLEKLMELLGKQNIDGILLEGGSTLNFSALECGIVDKVQFYIAPKIVGGIGAKTPVGGLGIASLNEAIKLTKVRTKFVGEDILVQGYVVKE